MPALQFAESNLMWYVSIDDKEKDLKKSRHKKDDWGPERVTNTLLGVIICLL